MTAYELRIIDCGSYVCSSALATQLANRLPPGLQPTGASYVWVLAGERTATGSPILANDPHLPLEAPGVWFLARLEAPGLTLVGATSPGVPFLLLGHNATLAWGFTTTHSDTQDFFIARRSEARRVGKEWVSTGRSRWSPAH